MTHKSLEYEGFYKIWRVNKQTGISELVVDKKNTILYQGADLLAKCLAGARYASISHMYVGYKTTSSIVGFTPPVIDKAYTNKFKDYNTVVAFTDLGFLRLPLAFSPTYLSTTNYNNNTVVFTSVVTASSTPATEAAAPFHDSGEASPSYLYEIALVAALDPTSSNSDLLFSRANFEPIIYDTNYNLNISWGINFTS